MTSFQNDNALPVVGRQRKRKVIWLAAVLAITAIAVIALRAPGWMTVAAGDGSLADPDNWTAHGRTAEEQRYSPLEQINAGNVASLKLAWSHDLDTSRGQEATPLIVDGVLYTSTAWSKVVALDAASGKELWKYDPQVPGRAAFNACCDVVSRGLAYNEGKVFLATLDGRLQALEATTGKVLWSTMTVDASKPYTITGAPRVFRGKVIIGNGGGELGVRGYVSAYDQNSGRQVWRFYTVPGDPAHPDHAASDDAIERLARKTWFGTAYYRYGGGGTVWDSIVYDPEFNQIYIGVGNGSPDSHLVRSEGKGDNLFLASIVALDPDTGKYKWHYQETPGETWDFTSSQQIMLASLKIGGQDRKVLLHAPKNGFFYVIDRSNGRLISAEKFMPVDWAERIDLKTGRPVEALGARYENAPFLSAAGGGGAHSWHSMAFSPKTGLVYIPAQRLPYFYKRTQPFDFRPGRWNLGFEMMRLPVPESDADRKAMAEANRGRLVAWDPVRQKEAWGVDHPASWNGGIVATGGNLVFQGTSHGTFEAYRASDGKKLWSFDTPTNIIAAPVSYSVGGVQYIAVLAGNGGAIPLTAPSFARTHAPVAGKVLAFRLNGTARLPDVSPMPLAPANPVVIPASAATVEQGRNLFADNCASCHGMSTHSGGIVPDLRRSQVLGNKDAWQQVVMEGLLQANGMIAFKEFLKPDEAEAIRAYVATEAVKMSKDKREAGSTR